MSKEIMQEKFEKLQKDIMTVTEWRKVGKILSKEEQYFADDVATRMIEMKTLNKSGVQLVSKGNLDFVKKYESEAAISTAGSMTQDVLETPQAKKGKDPIVSAGLEDVKSKKTPEMGTKSKELNTADEKGPESARHTPPADKVQDAIPENQKEGEVSVVANEKENSKDADGQPDVKIPSEEIGHQPNEPMPKKMAEDLIQNAKWGVEIGAYSNVKEGIERQLGRKSYSEFIDTDEKLKSVYVYLTSLVKETDPAPVA